MSETEKTYKQFMNFENIAQLLAINTGELTEHFEHDIEPAFHGIGSGLEELDYVTDGLKKGELVLIAGRPTHAKTSLANTFALHSFVSEEKNVIFFSLAQNSNALSLSWLSMYSSIDKFKLRRGMLEARDWQNFNKTINALTESSGNMLVNDEITDINGIEKHIYKLNKELAEEEQTIDLIIVDDLSHILAPNIQKNATESVDYALKRLKHLARELDVPVILVANTGRSQEARSDKRPLLPDLRDSSLLESIPDTILLTHREELYNPLTEHHKNELAITIAKSTGGSIGSARLHFDHNTQKITDWNQEDD